MRGIHGKKHNWMHVWIANGQTIECDESLVAAARSDDRQVMLSSTRRNDPGSWLEIFDSADNEVHRDFVEASSTPKDVCVEAENRLEGSGAL